MNQNMKYENISKKLKKLIVKLNILYNAMIFVDESQKVSSQVTNAIAAENSIISEIKSSEYILEDKMLKENLVEYISFADYMISKIMIRNTNTIDEEFISNLGINKDFENTNFYSKCKDFILDEISDLNDLLLFVDNEACRVVIKEKISKLLKSASESESNILFLDIQMWNEFFKLESMILEYIKTNTKDESKAHIKVLDKLKIDVDEKEIFVSPKTNAMLMLSTLNLSVSNEAIPLVMKILNTLDDNIRYKEIYFIVLLFDVLEDIISTENDLYKSIKKYVEKYPYSTKDLDRKKQEVKLQQNKEFIPFFKIQDYEIRTISKVLDRLNLEYKIEKDVLFLNLFYFEDLRNVRVSLVANAKNLI